MGSEIFDKMNEAVAANTASKTDDIESLIAEDSMDKQSYYGDARHDSEINSFQESDKPFLLTLVGFPYCGKTTFVSSIYHLCLSRGQIGKYKFVDSDTLIGFEKRAFIRQIDTETQNRSLRTQVYENGFLSLSFSDENNVIRKIVISDKSGETYKRYRDQEGLASEDLGLKYSDMIIFLLDGNTLLTSKMNEIKGLTNLLNRFASAGVFNVKDPLLYLGINKKDKCANRIVELEEAVKIIENKNRDYLHFTETVYLQSIYLNEDDKNSLENFVVSILDQVFLKKDPEEVIDIDWVNNMLNDNSDV